MKTIDANAKDLKAVNRQLRGSMNGDPVIVKNVEHIHGLAAGLNHGEVIIKGNTGDYLGVLNNGATIKVTENAGKFAADNMTKGTILIDGNADYGAGQYCYGGTIVVRGNAGDFTATMNKGATVIICGNVGDEAGTYMLSGDLIIIGDAGENFANYLIRGDVFIGGTWTSLGHNTHTKPLNSTEHTKLLRYFGMYDIDADPADFTHIVAASEKPFYK
jgi:glutamate synthase domain-containing protein 3